MELNIATKHRAASLESGKKANSLPGILPGLSGETAGNRPTIVLPHSEPLSEEQKKKLEPMIGLFGLDVITCF